MFAKDAYILNVRALPTGESKEEYLLTKSLFDRFENDDITACDVKCEAKIDRTEREISINFTFNGTITVACDRCLEPIDIKISSDEYLVLKFGQAVEIEDENVVMLSEKETVFDLSQFFFECVLVGKPFRCVHGEADESKCDESMIALIECQNKQKEKDNEETDPRWAALKKLK
ncbi:MAG: DUF177 domain-containing protein [Bacteroidales bacterium]|jgi:uncharacterized metal-binding protein YceD (DUF177 family)|nr:DUF177 domain-containing protein [Bacteroidales bacterium]